MNEIEAVGAEAALVATPTRESTAPERPWLFAFLIAPMAVLSNGVVNVLAFLLRRQDISVARSAEIISLLILPQTIYFLWSPLTDFFLRRRSWLMLGATASAVTEVLAFHQHNLAQPSAVALMFLSGCCGQLVVASCGGIMGTLPTERGRRTASSFYQAGSLAFGALGVFALAMLAEKLQQTTLGWIAGAMIAIPALAALAAPDQQTLSDGVLTQTLRHIWQEFKTTFLRWRAIPYILCLVLPMGSGAALGLLAGVAQDYRVSGHQVAWMNGIAGALLMAAGALAATLIPSKVRAPVALLSCSLLNALTLMVLWLGPLQPATYFTGVTLYLFTIGTSYSFFTAVMLEFMGDSGRSGSGRYAIINSIANIPVAYMTALDGHGDKLWGARGLSATDSVLSTLGAVILLAYFLSNRTRSTAKSQI